MAVGGQSHATPRLLYRQERIPVPLEQEAAVARGPVWTSAENLVRTGIRSPVRPALRQSLYQPRYAGPQKHYCTSKLVVEHIC